MHIFLTFTDNCFNWTGFQINIPQNLVNRNHWEGTETQWVTHSPPTSEVCGSNPGPNVGKLKIAFRWSAVYSTEP